LKPALVNSSQDSISKIPNTKRTGGVTQMVEHLPDKYESPTSNPVPPPPKKKKNTSKLPEKKIKKTILFVRATKILRNKFDRVAELSLQ
jgi:hypothetical protein